MIINTWKIFSSSKKPYDRSSIIILVIIIICHILILYFVHMNDAVSHPSSAVIIYNLFLFYDDAAVDGDIFLLFYFVFL